MSTVPHQTTLENIFTVYESPEGLNIYNLLQTVYVDPDMDSRLFTDYHARVSDSWTALSSREYNTTDLWWILVVCNRDRIENPVEFPPAGTKLRVPGPEIIRAIQSKII